MALVTSPALRGKMGQFSHDHQGWGEEDEDPQHQHSPKCPKQGQPCQAPWTNGHQYWGPCCRSFTWGLSLTSSVMTTFQTFQTCCPASSCQTPSGAVSCAAGRDDPEGAAPWPGHGAGQGHRGVLWSRLLWCGEEPVLEGALKNHRIIKAGKDLQGHQVQLLTAHPHAHCPTS